MSYDIDMNGNKEEFIKIYKRYIKREGAGELLAWIEKSDFFEAPASTKYHLNVPGGLCEHSLNVFYRLRAFLENEYLADHDSECPYDNETIALVSLLHDICKVYHFTINWRNQKNYDQEKVSNSPKYLVKHDADGDFIWDKMPYYDIDERFIYGHGEKSVYLIREFVKLTPEEAQAIRFHMGSWNKEEARNAGDVYAQSVLALYLHFADEAATFIDEA